MIRRISSQMTVHSISVRTMIGEDATPVTERVKVRSPRRVVSRRASSLQDHRSIVLMLEFTLLVEINVCYYRLKSIFAAGVVTSSRAAGQVNLTCPAGTLPVRETT